MDHLRGNLFDTEGQTRFEGLEITIETRTASGGGEEWSGYFEPPTASGLISGEVFRLVLEDGRARDIEIKGVQAVGHGRARILF
jgi:hypothetical protein